jgi:hypothetical protein
MSQKVRFIVFLLGSLLLTVFGREPVEAAPTYVRLQWTAPGDDSLTGKATRYDLRYATGSMSAASFNAARAAPGLPIPQSPGSHESYTLSGLAPDSTYFIAIKTVDDAGNWSAISNIFIRDYRLLAVEDDGSQVAFTEPWPNPAHNSIRLSLHLPRTATTQIHVFDIMARRVRTLESGWRGPGAVPVSWDLRDEQGRRVSPGAYLIVASALGRQWVRRVVVIG